jgi:uncharacterized membrane protein
LLLVIDCIMGSNTSTEQLLEEHQEKPLRSMAKAVSWRILGSLDTVLLSWFFTSELTIAIAIGGTEVFTKIVLYYFHERLWNRIPLGLS